MANNNQIKIDYVTGVSKKTNHEYFACRVSFPTVTGAYRDKMVFFNDLEIQLLGLTKENFSKI